MFPQVAAALFYGVSSFMIMVIFLKTLNIHSYFSILISDSFKNHSHRIDPLTGFFG